jgi:DNA-binding NarL/FixJ family response regulator
MINVIIADDQIILRDSLKIALEQDSDIRVIACADNGMEAFSLCKEFQPDIVLMDIVMPVYDGIQGTRLIKEKYKEIKVIILTTFADSENIDKAIRNGADGYVLKDISSAELIAAIKNTVTNLTVIHQNVFNALKENYLIDNDVSMLKKPINIEFSEQELNIIKMVVIGKSN